MKNFQNERAATQHKSCRIADCGLDYSATLELSMKLALFVYVTTLGFCIMLIPIALALPNPTLPPIYFWAGSTLFTVGSFFVARKLSNNLR